MKLKSIFFISCFLFIIFNSSQIYSQPFMKFGAKVAVSTVNEDLNYTYLEKPDLTRLTVVDFALFLEWFNTDFFSLISQIEYNRQGWKNDVYVTTSSGPEAVGKKNIIGRIDYFSIPLLLKFKLRTDFIDPYVIGGPRLDFKLAHDSDYDAYEVILKDFNKNKFSATLGFGLEFKLSGSQSLLFETIYNFDLTESYKTELLKIKANSFNFWFGIAL